MNDIALLNATTFTANDDTNRLLTREKKKKKRKKRKKEKRKKEKVIKNR